MRPISELPDVIKERWGTPYGVCFTYGDLVYADTDKLPKDVEIHENVHKRQQQKPHEWWERYNKDPKFRYEQELEAYRAQYHYLKSVNRIKAFDMAKVFAAQLSGEMYEKCAVYNLALRDITS
jgi:hypothetical protein